MEFKKETYLYGLSFLLVSVVLIAFLAYPLFQKIRINSKHFAENEKKLINLEKKREDFIKLQERHKSLEGKFEKIDQVFVNKEIPIGFIEFLEETAPKSFPIEISPAPSEEKKELWVPVLFRVSGKGSFPDFTQFLKKIENAPYLIKIKKLIITRVSEREREGKPGEVKVQLLLETYSK